MYAYIIYPTDEVRRDLCFADDLPAAAHAFIKERKLKIQACFSVKDDSPKTLEELFSYCQNDRHEHPQGWVGACYADKKARGDVPLADVQGELLTGNPGAGVEQAYSMSVGDVIWYVPGDGSPASYHVCARTGFERVEMNGEGIACF